MVASYSLFTSPAFILTESSFIIVASIAAYEILVGDFIWAQQEEARRALQQQQLTTNHQLGQNRSLSPGGRGRGHRPPPSSSRRGTPNEESYLLYPSSRRGSPNDIATEEQGYYSVPGGSPGDSTRRLFYKMAFFALLSRFILLPIETYCLSFQSKDNSSTIPSYVSTLLQVLLRLSQTFPDVVFASALGLLVIFCVKIAFAALPPLTPDSREGSVHGGEGNIESGTLVDREGFRGDSRANKRRDNLEDNKEVNTANTTKKDANITWCTAAARVSRTLLASKRTFHVWNVILLLLYTLVFFTALVIPHAPLSMCERYLWMLMGTIYSLLILSLIYASALLGRVLHSGLMKRSNGGWLAFRLVGTLTLLAIMFIERLILFGMMAHDAVVNMNVSNTSDVEETILHIYRRSTMEYAFSESLPVFLILLMMHRKRKEIQSDVLIIHSIINNIFGSSGKLVGGSSYNTQLDTPTTSASGDGGTANRVGGLGSRRFQTYGGTSRGDSFPPASAGNNPRRNINLPRALSSSGPGKKQNQLYVPVLQREER